MPRILKFSPKVIADSVYRDIFIHNPHHRSQLNISIVIY